MSLARRGLIELSSITRYKSSMQDMGGGTRVVVSTAAFHARVRGSAPGLKETKMFLPHPRVKVSIVGSLRDREVACSASDRQGSNFESCVWMTVSSHSCAQRWPKARIISFHFYAGYVITFHHKYRSGNESCFS